MLLSKEQIKQLKQKNVSVNSDITKSRLKADFSAASTATKQAIIELSGQGRHSFYRAFGTGTANARIVLAMAQVLNVQPWYYTGEIDKRESLDVGQTAQFLKVHGYNDLAKQLGVTSARRKPGPKPKIKTEVSPAPAPAAKKPSGKKEETPPAPVAEASSTGIIGYENVTPLDIPREEVVQLIEALYTQAKYSEEAKRKLDVLQNILVKT